MHQRAEKSKLYKTSGHSWRPSSSSSIISAKETSMSKSGHFSQHMPSRRARPRDPSRWHLVRMQMLQAQAVTREGSQAPSKCLQRRRAQCKLYKHKQSLLEAVKLQQNELYKKTKTKHMQSTQSNQITGGRKPDKRKRSLLEPLKLQQTKTNTSSPFREPQWTNPAKQTSTSGDFVVSRSRHDELAHETYHNCIS